MMRRSVVLGVMLVPALVMAQSQHFVAQVTRTVPIVQHQTVTVQNCVTETVTQQSGSGGAVTGAIVGGVVGSQVARGGDRALGAGVGAIAGAVIGDNAARQPTVQQRCTPVTTTQPVTVGYDVTWTWRGHTMTQRMNRDPGSHVTVTVTAH